MVKIEIKSEFETEKKRKTETESEIESEKKRKTGEMETKFSLKLLINKPGKKVLFAEAGKDCVDFLLFILSLPLSTVVRLLGKQEMVGSVANLYESVEALSNTLFIPNITKDDFLKLPVPPRLRVYSDPLLRLKDEMKDEKKFFACFRSHGTFNNQGIHVSEGIYVSDDYRTLCPKCRIQMTTPAMFVGYAPMGGGFVKEEKRYMVMDDLAVKPMLSAISSISLLNEFNIKDVSQLEEKVVNLGMNEAVKLLKASLVSKNVLTSVFLNANQ